MREWRDERARKLLQHAYDTVPYYRREMDGRGLRPEDVGGVDDLRKMPVLTRGAVRENRADLMSRGYPRGRMKMGLTSGSTGDPLVFFRTLHQWGWERAAELRALHWYDFPPGEKGAYFQPGRRLPVVLKLRLQGGVYFDTHYVNETVLDRMTTRLRESRITRVRGPPSALYYLARYVENSGVELELDVVVSSFENLDREVREVIEDAFRCRVYDFYGSNEVGCIAAECPESGRYMVAGEVVHVEVEERSGGLGDVLVTSLWNYGMPLIRYAIGDLASSVEGPCACGMPYQTFSDLEGRTPGVIVLRDGTLYSTAFVGPVRGLPIEKYQVRQKDYETLHFYVVPGEGFDRDDEEVIERRTEDRVPGVEVEVLRTEEIPPLPSGKHQFVVSEVEYEPEWLG